MGKTRKPKDQNLDAQNPGEGQVGLTAFLKSEHSGGREKNSQNNVGVPVEAKTQKKL